MGKQYSYSRDEEHYTGKFDTIEAAIDEAAADVGVGGTFWVGEIVPPPSPELYWRADDWIERVSIHDEYCGDWAEGWDRSTKAQQDELETEVHAVMAKWLDRHDLRPRHWNINHAQRFYVADKVGDVYEIEAVGATTYATAKATR